MKIKKSVIKYGFLVATVASAIWCVQVASAACGVAQQCFLTSAMCNPLQGSWTVKSVNTGTESTTKPWEAGTVACGWKWCLELICPCGGPQNLGYCEE